MASADGVSHFEFCVEVLGVDWIEQISLLNIEAATGGVL